MGAKLDLAKALVAAKAEAAFQRFMAQAMCMMVDSLAGQLREARSDARDWADLTAKLEAAIEQVRAARQMIATLTAKVDAVEAARENAEAGLAMCRNTLREIAKSNGLTIKASDSTVMHCSLARSVCQ